ncbi:hypothetical protein Tco_1147422, partial [Tanacetum coccineum]
DTAKGRAKVAWKHICKPKEQGGLGIKDLEIWNDALLLKHVWNIASKKDTLWIKWIHMMKLKDYSIWNVQINESDSWNWKCLLEIRDKMADKIQYKAGDRRNICMWYDKWHDSGLLIDKISNRDFYDARIPKMINIDDIIDRGVWKLPNEWNSSEFEVMKIRPPRLQSGMIDKVKWKGKENTLVPFNTKLVMEALRRLLNQDRIMKWGQLNGLLCPLCSKICDSHSHLFYQCDYAMKIWNVVAKKLNLIKIGYHREEIIFDLIETKKRNNIWSMVRRTSLAAVVYSIWHERNKRIFTREKRKVTKLQESVNEVIKLKMMNLRVRESNAAKKVAKI